MSASWRRWFLCLLAGVFVLEALGFARVLELAPHDFFLRSLTGGEEFISAGLWGAVVFFVAEVGFVGALPTLAAGLALDGVLSVPRVAGGLPWAIAVLTSGVGVGFAAQAALALRAYRLRTAESQTAAFSAVILPSFILVIQPVLVFSSILHPRVYDGLMFRTDLQLVGPLAFWLGSWAADKPLLSRSLWLVYTALPVVFAVTCVHERRQRSRQPDLLHEFMVLGVLGFVLYNVLPVVGPIFFFADYPHFIPDAAGVPLTTIPFNDPIPRNCVPSLHLAWALSISCRLWLGGAVPVRVATAVFMVLTSLATLALGFHYAMDLVLGVLLMFTVRALLRPRGRGPAPWLPRLARWLPAAMLALWYVLLLSRSENILLEFRIVITGLAVLSLILPAASEHYITARTQLVEDDS